MDVSEENVICRLCLKELTENCEPIEEILQHMLSFLTLCPNLTISDDPMMCETCALNLKKCFDFKTRCLSTEDCISSFAEDEGKKVNLRDIYSKVKLDGNLDAVPDDHSVCRFCLELVKYDASTNLLRHNVDLFGILQEYFLEMDLRNTDDIIACTACYNSLQFHVNFVNDYLSVEGKINDYCRVEGVKHKDQVDLRDVASFISKSMLNVENISGLVIKEEKHENIINTDVDVKVKLEDPTDVEQVKEKLIDKEIQQSDSNSLQHPPSPSQSDCVPQLTRAKPAAIYTCKICGYQNNHKRHFQAHVLTHKSIDQEAKYNCKVCSFKAKIKDHLKKHMLNHKDASKITMYKCPVCSYQAKHKHHLIDHMITHKDDTEMTVYKCCLCDYEAKHKFDLKKHLLTHKTHSNMYKCDLCDYKTKQMGNLKRHMLIHKTYSEVTIYKCDLCDHETKRKQALKRHMLIHSESTMYKCEVCPYETKHMNCLKVHALSHKNRSEIKMHKCEVCPFETKWYGSLRNHRLSHRDTTDVITPGTMHKTKRKSDVKKYIHKTYSEIGIFQCYHCGYEAKWKSALRRHLLTHRDPTGATLYKCEACAYETRHKDYLRQHKLKHMDVSEIKMYKCKVCPYETRWNSSFRKHLRFHRNTSDVAT